MEYCPFTAHKFSINSLWFFFNVFSSMVIQQISCLLCQSGYLLLVMFSSDVILFPEGTFRLKVSMKSLQLLFIDGNGWYNPQAIMMDSPFCRELTMNWMITDLHLPVLLQPFTVPISIPASTLRGAQTEKGCMQKGPSAEAWGGKSESMNSYGNYWLVLMVSKELSSTFY